MSSINQLYQTVTAAIVSELEMGAAPWLKPWNTSVANGSSLLPSNAATGRHYHGINIPILWHQASERGYSTHQWLTFNQAKEKGANVRKGEKATQVVFTKKLRIKDRETEEEKQISMLRGYFVFNVGQVEGLPEHPTTGSTLPTPEERTAQVDCFIGATRADIRHGGYEACFIPSLDYIAMPPFAAFKTTEGYYATGLHELGHNAAVRIMPRAHPRPAMLRGQATRQFGIIRGLPGRRAVCRLVDIDLVMMASLQCEPAPAPSVAGRRGCRSAWFPRTRVRARAR